MAAEDRYDIFNLRRSGAAIANHSGSRRRVALHAAGMAAAKTGESSDSRVDFGKRRHTRRFREGEGLFDQREANQAMPLRRRHNAEEPTLSSDPVRDTT